MPIRRLPFLLLLPLLLTACGSAWWLERTSFPEDRALARAAIADLAAGNRLAFARRFPETVRPQLASQFALMRGALPVRGAAAPVLVDAGWASVSAIGGRGYRDARLTYELAGSDRRALAQMVIRRQGGSAIIAAFNVARIDRPATEINGFRAGDASLDNVAVVALAVAGLALTGAAIWRVWASGRFRRRWLWIAGCLIGWCRFTTVWGTAHIGFSPVSVTLLSAGAVRHGLGPWTVFAGLPVIAIWALLRHRALKGEAGDG